MKIILTPITIFIFFVIAFNQIAQAESPSFDCSKSSSSVEQLICSDGALTALDLKLNDVYKKSYSEATLNLKAKLREEQRGWVSGRNDCWKATVQTWITANWTVNSVKDCIDAQYRLRTSELQSTWRIVKPKTTYYGCQNNLANEVIVNYFETDPATIRLERGDKTYTLWHIADTNPALYEGKNISVVEKDGKLKVKLLNVETGATEELQCSAK